MAIRHWQSATGRGPRLLRTLALLYGLLCLASLVLMLLGLTGWLGVTPTPLSPAYALLLALPWTMLARGLYSPALVVGAILAGMIINFLLLAALGRWLAGRH